MTQRSSDRTRTGTRVAKATRNDEALRRAVVVELAESGWDALSARSVSARAGLSYGAIYARHARLEGLVAQVWDELLWPELQGRLDAVVDSVLKEPDEERFVTTMCELAQPSTELLAAIELVQASLVDPQAATFVRPAVDELLQRRTSPEPPSTAVAATVAATCLYVAVGLLLLGRRRWTRGTQIDSEMRRYHRALLHPSEPLPAPADLIAEYLYTYAFDTDDERLERVLFATAISVGEVGYHATTLAKVARIAGVSTGFITSRFQSKAALFERVTDEMWGRGMNMITEFIAETAASLGPAMAEALAWREMQNPAIAKVSVLSIETARLAGFDPSMAEIVEEQEAAYLRSVAGLVPPAYVHSEYALGNGMVALACFRPDLHLLPFSCVTDPLVASAPG